MILSRHYSGSPASQRGVALITALIIVALVTVITVSAATSQQYDVRRTLNVLDNDRAYLFALGAETWAKQVLAQDAQDNQTDHENEDWNTAITDLPVEGATISGRVEDLQGRFNLNNLIDDDGRRSAIDVELFQRLLVYLDIDRELADAVVDWLDDDIDATLPGGAEDGTYLAAQRPYRAANRTFVSPSELQLVQGFSREIYDALAPFISALPEHGVPINVNTAAPEVLMMLGEGITEVDADELLTAREDSPFESPEEFLNHSLLEQKKNDLAADRIAVGSRYFLVHALAEFGNGRSRLYSVVQRGAQNSGKVAVVMRGQGTF